MLFRSIFSINRNIVFLLFIKLYMLMLVFCSCNNIADPVNSNPLDPANPNTSGDPFRLTAIVGASAVNLAWQAVALPDLVGYRIFKRLGLSGDFVAQQPDLAANVFQFVDTQIESGQTYMYKVVALVLGQQSDESTPQAVTVHSLAEFSINNGADSTAICDVYLYFRAAHCDSLWVWNGTASDSASGRWLIKNNDIDVLDWNLVGGSDIKTVRACLHYTTGQRAIVYDTIAPAPPSAPSVIINDGAEFTADQNVFLSLSAGGAVTMIISNSIDYQGFFWEEYAPGKFWDISNGDGIKTVFAKFRNGFDLESQATAAITLDQTPPSVLNIWGAPMDSTDHVKPPVLMSWGGAIDDGSGIEYYRLILDPHTSPSSEIYCGQNADYCPDMLTDFTKYYWRIVVVDGAGNESEGPIWHFYYPSLDFVYVPAGLFTMGSPLDEPGRDPYENQHTVNLTRGFYMSRYEVTEKWWNEVMSLEPSSSLMPKTGVFWDIAVVFCNRLSIQSGLNRAYNIYGNDGDVEWNQSSNGYRLPTEAEWEYACRAGSQTAFANGPITHVDCSPLDVNLNAIGWYCGNSSGNNIVGTKIPNQWGLYDMHGNVCEMVWDSFRSDYENLSADNPSFNGGGYTSRVYRGGFSYIKWASSCRSAWRGSIEPDMEVGGLRPVRTAF